MKRRMFSLILVISLISTAGVLVAQDQSGTISQIFRIEPVQGPVAPFEKAYSEHLDWHRERNDSWRWDGWEYIAGRYTGQYAVVTQGHKWADFDRGEVGKADKEHAQEVVFPYVENTTIIFARTLPNLSTMPETAAVPKLISVTVYYIEPGKVSDFMVAVRQLHSALKEAGWDRPYSWNIVAQGAEDRPMVYLLSPHDSWASFAPQEKSMLDTLDEKLGRNGTEKLRELFWAPVDSVENHILAYRPDLSYAP